MHLAFGVDYIQDVPTAETNDHTIYVVC